MSYTVCKIKVKYEDGLKETLWTDNKEMYEILEKHIEKESGLKVKESGLKVKEIDYNFDNLDYTDEEIKEIEGVE